MDLAEYSVLPQKEQDLYAEIKKTHYFLLGLNYLDITIPILLILSWYLLHSFLFLNSFLKNLPNCELYCLSEEGICISAIACEYKRAINNINVVWVLFFPLLILLSKIYCLGEIFLK